jgi:hypothetical protein
VLKFGLRCFTNTGLQTSCTTETARSQSSCLVLVYTLGSLHGHSANTSCTTLLSTAIEVLNRRAEFAPGHGRDVRPRSRQQRLATAIHQYAPYPWLLHCQICLLLVMPTGSRSVTCLNGKTGEARKARTIVMTLQYRIHHGTGLPATYAYAHGAVSGTCGHGCYPSGVCLVPCAMIPDPTVVKHNAHSIPNTADGADIRRWPCALVRDDWNHI